MVDFVGLLKRTIDAQSSATPVLRRRIYDRTRETVERQLSSKPMPPEVAALQRRMLEKAIDEVENFYLDGGGRDSVSPSAVNAGSGHPQEENASAPRGGDVFNQLRRNAGMNPAPARPRAAGGRGYIPEISPYGAPDDADDDALVMPHPAVYAGGGARGSAGVSIGAYGEDISSADARRGGAAQSRGNLREARPSSSPAGNEAAHGGIASARAAARQVGGQNFTPYGSEAPIRGIFPLDDEEDAGFPSDRGETARPAAQPQYSGGRRGLHPYDDGMPAQKRETPNPRAADDSAQPMQPLPDYGRAYPQESREPQFSGNYGEPAQSAPEERDEPHFLNSYGDENAAAAGHEVMSGRSGGYDEPDFSQDAGGYDEGGYGRSNAGAQAQIPPSPYNIAENDFSANYRSEPKLSGDIEPQVSASVSQPEFESDLPPLHDFLFGSENADDAPEEPRPASSLPEAGYEDSGFPAPPIAADALAAETGAARKPAQGQQKAEQYIAEPPRFTEPEPFLESDSEDRETAMEDDYSPLPDFFPDEPDAGAGDSKSANGAQSQMTEDEQIAFNLQQALVGHEDSEIARKLAQKKAAQEKQKNKTAEIKPEDVAPLPDDFLIPEDMPAANALGEGGHQPEMGGKSKQKGESRDAGSLSVSADSAAASIFAQSAMREKKRSGKKRLITGGTIILAVLIIAGGIVWFLKDYAKSDAHKAAPIAAAATDAPAQKTNTDKVNQRLTPDGQEVNAAPAAPQAAAKDDTVEQAIKQASLITSKGDVLFRESKTALMPATEAKGTANWSVVHEKTDTLLRANISVPDRDMVMRMTIRPNHDKTIPAVYIAEFMFVVPENFEGQAVDKISPLMLKPTENSTPQNLMDSHVYKINDNFFVMTMNVPTQTINPQLQRNIALIEQLPWMTMNVAYKNGRIGEFTFSKGDNGDAVFKQFFDAQSAAAQGQASRPDSNAGSDSAPALNTQPGK